LTPTAKRTRYVSGQSLSLISTWVETVAHSLLVLRLTHSGTILGLTTAASYAPILLLSPYAGLLVDRYAKRRVLLGTQEASAWSRASSARPCCPGTSGRNGRRHRDRLGGPEAACRVVASPVKVPRSRPHGREAASTAW
jgi:hypothetical protein